MVVQWNYYKGHKAIFEKEGSSWPNFSVLVDDPGIQTLLNVTEIHEVQEVWTSQQGLKATNHAAKSLPKGHAVLRCGDTLNESPNIIGLKGVHLPEALCWCKADHSFCPWCGMEGQNEGTVMNHLRTVHYHYGLVCTVCVDFFSASADAMRWHMHMSVSP